MKKQTDSCPPELPASILHNRCDPASLGFSTTDELPDLQDVIGQPRALRALELGSEVAGAGYNIFVLGAPGSGRTTLSQEYLQRKAENEPVPDDWCYVFNFDNPHAPHALCLPAGQGQELRKDMQSLVTYCEREIPKAFESQEYIQDRDRILNELKKTQEDEFQQLQEHVGKFNFLLMRTSAGVVLTPSIQGHPLETADVEKLSPEQREKFKELVVQLSADVERTLNHLRELGHTADQKLKELHQKMITYIIEPMIRNLTEKYAPDPSATYSQTITAFLHAVQSDISTNSAQFKQGEVPEQALPQPAIQWSQRYAVNVLTDNCTSKGAPVIIESQPTYSNLLGRIEHEVVMGVARTDFTMIRPGVLHRANGGYLILPARDLLNNPYAWEALKRVLRDGAIRMIELSNQMGLISTPTLEPEPVPLQVKILLIGTPLLYHLLRSYDEDFSKLFKVQAEFATVMDRTAEAEHEYGLFIKSVLVDHHLPPFDHTAVARIIEQSSRLAEEVRP